MTFNILIPGAIAPYISPVCLFIAAASMTIGMYYWNRFSKLSDPYVALLICIPIFGISMWLAWVFVPYYMEDPVSIIIPKIPFIDVSFSVGAP